MLVQLLRLITIFGVILILCQCSQPGANSTKLEKINLQQWQQQLASYKGEIVVVDMWAMWCLPCIKRFPKMVELDQRYRSQGVRFVGLNLDNMNDSEAIRSAENFIREVNATFDNYHIQENLIDAFNQLGLTGIPVVVIYDEKGAEYVRLTGGDPSNQFTEKDIEQAISSLLSSG